MVLSIRPHVMRLCTASSTFAYKNEYHLLVSQTLPDQFSRKTNIKNDVNMLEVNFQLKLLVKSGRLSEARQMFDKMPRRDEISWTNIISGYVNAMDATESLVLFSCMWVEPGLRMDPFIISLALKACRISLSVKCGVSLHGYSVKSGFVNSVFVGSALLDMYMKSSKIELGCRVFGEMPIRNVVSWTAIITGLVHAGYGKEGLVYLSEMWRSGVHLDSYTFAIALKACADSGALNYGREIHCLVLKRGFDVTSFVANSLATMYNKCGKLDYGLLLFERMSTRDVVSWTTIISNYVQMGQGEHAIEVFIRMQGSGVKPNVFTFAAVISGCASLARFEWGEQLHAHVLCLGLADYLSVANSIVTMYAKCGQLSSASFIFHGMTRRDIVSWSTIIGVYAQDGYWEEAFQYLSLMRREGPKPNEFALASVLSVCGQMAILEEGKQLHAYVLFIGLENTAMIQSALINMYSKCGSIKEAAKIFDEAEIDDIVSWTAMINGYAENGYSREAVEIFEKIPVVGLRPDSVTFIGVLTACSHAGLVDIGFHYFNLMSKEYQINPSKEHYGCMVDLLCRAGRLSDAERMIKSMPHQRNDVVWSTLLRACRVHGDVDCGKRTAEKILELDPSCAGTHITMANIYAAKGRWREVADVRKMMQSKGVIKEPGWSWIKVKDLVSAFVSGDRSHLQGEDIYSMLDILTSRTESAIQEIDLFLYDVKD
ncbi:PPR domain-containing protein/PPR_2 domain-containing protein [Cephalotus follicularis]|uniref:PPR domain-containing protein/PPR_2 domain-containing protein n=1 Tax=Cephalotus follicularis TaxID=3775 RepID=A0A1Q3D5L5_CEPFO|nr:PPR domain-containing protein/PPR_2 domain-containing protein [Cephalotus follicularis]